MDTGAVMSASCYVEELHDCMTTDISCIYAVASSCSEFPKNRQYLHAVAGVINEREALLQSAHHPADGLDPTIL
jgi:hypothetical protein